MYCFLVFGYPGETLALFVHILHERDLFFTKFAVSFRLMQTYCKACNNIFESFALANVLPNCC